MEAEIGEMPGKEISELQHSEKFLKEENTPIVRQAADIAGDFDISRQILHSEQLLTNSYDLFRRLSTLKSPVPTGPNLLFGRRDAPDSGAKAML